MLNDLIDNEGYDKNCIAILTFCVVLYWSYCMLVVQNYYSYLCIYLLHLYLKNKTITL